MHGRAQPQPARRISVVRRRLAAGAYGWRATELSGGFAVTVAIAAAALTAAPADPAHAAWSLVQGRTAGQPSPYVRAAVRIDRTRIDRLDVKYRATCRRGGRTQRWSTVMDYTNIRVRDGRFSLCDRFRHPQTGDLDDNRVRGTIGADGSGALLCRSPAAPRTAPSSG